MSKKITSYNQSGGITAENVNVDSQVNASNVKIDSPNTSKKKSKWGKILGLLVAVATIASGVLALLQYLGFGGGNP